MFLFYEEAAVAFLITTRCGVRISEDPSAVAWAPWRSIASSCSCCLAPVLRPTRAFWTARLTSGCGASFEEERTFRAGLLVKVNVGAIIFRILF